MISAVLQIRGDPNMHTRISLGLFLGGVPNLSLSSRSLYLLASFSRMSFIRRTSKCSSSSTRSSAITASSMWNTLSYIEPSPAGRKHNWYSNFRQLSHVPQERKNNHGVRDLIFRMIDSAVPYCSRLLRTIFSMGEQHKLLDWKMALCPLTYTVRVNMARGHVPPRT